MKVWIDQDLCTGDGLCEEIAPAVFTLLDDGLAYVKEDGDVKNDPGGSAGMAAVPGDLEEAVVEASEECPGECIFIERTDALAGRADLTRLRPSEVRRSLEPPRRREEPGVADHAMVGAHRAGLDVPGAAHDLLCLGQAEVAPASSSAWRSSAVWLMVGR